jgi:hypothetical protein
MDSDKWRRIWLRFFNTDKIILIQAVSHNHTDHSHPHIPIHSAENTSKYPGKDLMDNVPAISRHTGRIGTE